MDASELASSRQICLLRARVHQPWPKRLFSACRLKAAHIYCWCYCTSTPPYPRTLPQERIRARGLTPVPCIEKGDLVRQLLEHGGSSAASCSICCEDYGAAAPVGPTATANEQPAHGEGRDDAAGIGADGAESGSQGGGGGEEGEVLRVLRCGHRFHVECVDKWFLSATDYTREPACPLCNAPLLAGSGGTGAGAAAGR